MLDMLWYFIWTSIKQSSEDERSDSTENNVGIHQPGDDDWCLGVDEVTQEQGAKWKEKEVRTWIMEITDSINCNQKNGR